MGRTVKNRTPIHPKPVEKIELSSEHIGLRAAAALIFLVLGASALAYTFVNFLNGEKGWREINVSSGAVTCADDFIFMYDVGSGGSVHSENRTLTLLYSELAKKAYEVFSAEVDVEGVHNLCYLNRHPNEEIVVEPALYSAFEKIEGAGSRYIYLGPAYAVYDSLFFLESPEYADAFDPELDPEMAEFYRQISFFARSEKDVNLELLGDNRVKLRVSQGYLDFAEENGIERFIDLYWLKNAFITDFLSENIIAAGYTNGTVSSYDGYSRCLSQSDESFDYTLYCSYEGVIYPAAVMEYSGQRAIVNLRAYPLNGRDKWRFTKVAGKMRSQYLSLTDGANHTAAEEITSYSTETGCADIALALADIYIADELDMQKVITAREKGIETVVFDGEDILCTDESITLKQLYTADDRAFSAKTVR